MARPKKVENIEEVTENKVDEIKVEEPVVQPIVESSDVTEAKIDIEESEPVTVLEDKTPAAPVVKTEKVIVDNKKETKVSSHIFTPSDEIIREYATPDSWIG